MLTCGLRPHGVAWLHERADLDPALAGAMTATGVTVREETLIDSLLADLRSTPSEDHIEGG
ncbi:hypothetical protein ACFO0C_09310 [Actinoplanes subglobosus]|uniref:Uncharacterized protein n=1 Tax=Actinoplanes subglobosus TaxID=1547892 RepID=A0ABV8ILP9_9ACTN